MAAPWEPELDFYLAQIGESPVSFVIDMAAARHAPLATHTLRVEVRVRMRTPRADGLRDASELDALGEVEDQVAARLEAAVGAIYVGRFVARGYTTLVAYAPESAAGLLSDVGALIGSLGVYSSEWRVAPDPEWKLYFEFLYPDVYSRQFMQNRRLVQVIAEHGDKLEVPRMVDHTVFFASAERAQEAANELVRLEFEVQAAELVLDDDGKPRQPEAWMLSFRRKDSIEQRRIDEICAEVLDVILPLDGIYDGWGAPLVTDAS